MEDLKDGWAALLEALVTLAGTPDDDPAVEAHLRTIAQLVPATVAAVDSASVTVTRDGRYLTLASSDERTRRVDHAQYREGTGPCLQALHDEQPVAVPETAAATEWPRFREQAMSEGLYAALSIPLYAGSGSTIGSLNLYARRPDTLCGLILAVLALYQPEPCVGINSSRRHVDDGTEHLVDALAAALRVYDDIQHALGMLMAERGLSAAEAYSALRELAHARNSGLHTAALEQLTHVDT